MFGFNATTVVASLPLLVKLFGADSADVVSPSPSFSSSPSFTSTFSATESCEIECKTDYDCPSVCVRDDSYSPFGACVGGIRSRDLEGFERPLNFHLEMSVGVLGGRAFAL